MPSTRDATPWTRRAFLRAAGVGAGSAALGSLPGCSSGGGGSLGGDSSGGEVTELIVPTASTPWAPAYAALVAGYQEVGGVKITLREFPYDGLVTQYTNAIQSGSGVFDIFQLDEPWIGEFYANEWVTPVADIDPDFRLDPEVLTYADLPTWDPDSQTSSPDGQLMGIPMNGNLELHVRRTDLYEELGLDVPTTWEQALENGRAAVSSGQVEFGYAPRAQATPSGQSITYSFMPVFYSYGADWFADPGTDWTPTVNSPEAVEAITMYRALAELGPPDTTSMGQAEVTALVQSGRVLQTHLVAAAASQLLDPELSQVTDTTGFAMLPGGPQGVTPTSGTWTLAVPAGLPDERATAAADFLAWLAEQEQQSTFASEGGIPNRRDVLAGDLPTAAQPYLTPLTESLEQDIRPSIRYTFATPMLEAAEQALAAITAGETEPQPGMDRLQDDLAAIVREAGLLG